MSGVIGVVTAWALAASSAPIPPPGFDAIFSQFKADTPGCSVGVRHADDPPIMRAYGSADLERPTPNTPQTVFEIGSVSKQVTAAAILALVQNGKLSLTDDVRKYVPELPDYGAKITVDNLLSHTSGLRDWFTVESLTGWGAEDRPNDFADALQVVTRQKALNHTPGVAYSYTNAGYLLAAIIVKRVSGQSLADFTRERFFQPLGMTHSRWREDFRKIVPRRAIAYSQFDDGSWGQDMPLQNVYGDGGLQTTVEDLLIWTDALAAGKLGPGVAAGLVEHAVLKDGTQIPYGRGIAVTSHNGEPELSHTGYSGGYRAWLARYPRQRLTVAVLCNDGEIDPDDLGYAVADLYIPAPTVKAGAKRETSAQELATRPGLYVSEQKGYVDHVIAKDGALSEGPNQPPFTPDGAGRYRVGDVIFVFEGDRLERRMPDGDVVVFRHIKPETSATADLERATGRYTSAEAGAALDVALKDGRLVATFTDRPSVTFVLKPLYRDAFFGRGSLVRLVRDKGGKVDGLRFTRSRVYDLVFAR